MSSSTRERIVDEAMLLFSQRGYAATSIAKIEAAAGLTPGAGGIYHHFASKEALLSAALDEALDGLTTAIDTALAATGTDAGQRLRAVVRESVEILVRRLPAVTLLLRVRGNSEVELAALKRRRVLDDKLAALVAEAVAEGSLRPDIPPELISRLLFGTVNSLAEWYRPGGPADAGLIAEAIVSMAFDGLARE